jgi:hypothetical protein
MYSVNEFLAVLPCLLILLVLAVALIALVIFAFRKPKRATSTSTKVVKNPNAGFVYIVRGLNGPEEYFKIGRTVNPDSRLKTFKNKFPFTVEYALVIRSDNYKKLEKDLHYRFKDKRVEGEWFRLTYQDMHQLYNEYYSQLWNGVL